MMANGAYNLCNSGSSNSDSSNGNSIVGPYPLVC